MFRKTFSIIIGMLLVLGIIGCGMPMAKRRLLYSTPPSDLYSQMILTLQDLGWTMTNTDKGSLTILARKTRTLEEVSAALGGEKAKPYQASINFRKKDGKVLVSITITQPGKIIKSGTPKKLSNEIIKAFKKRVGPGQEIEIAK